MSYADPRIFWARTYAARAFNSSQPPRRPQMWIHGRDLIRVGERFGSEHNARPQAFIHDSNIPLALIGDGLRPNNGHGPNRALRECVAFSLPANLPTGDHKIRLVRNDGAEAFTTTWVGPRAPLPNYQRVDLDKIGDYGEISAPIILPPNTHLDLDGLTLRPHHTFTGPALIIADRSCTVVNGSLHVREDDPTVHPIITQGNFLQLRDLDIINDQPGGVGVFMRSTFDSEFLDISISADRAFELFPGQQSRRNVFSRVSITGPRGNADSDCGRGMGGSDNLLTWCHWHDIDRGPTIQSHGSPISRMLLFECSQHNTGLSQGASEGLLFETGGVLSPTVFRGRELIVSLASVNPRERDRVVQPGNIVANMDGNRRWARIITATRAAAPSADSDYQIIIDRPVTGDPADTTATIEPGTAYVGSAVTECTIARSQFSQGRAGITLWGPSIDTHIIDNQFSELDNGIITLERAAPTVAFHWDLDTRENVRRRVFSYATKVSRPEQILAPAG